MAWVQVRMQINCNISNTVVAEALRSTSFMLKKIINNIYSVMATQLETLENSLEEEADRKYFMLQHVLTGSAARCSLLTKVTTSSINQISSFYL